MKSQKGKKIFAIIYKLYYINVIKAIGAGIRNRLTLKIFNGDLEIRLHLKKKLCIQ